MFKIFKKSGMDAKIFEGEQKLRLDLGLEVQLFRCRRQEEERFEFRFLYPHLNAETTILGFAPLVLSFKFERSLIRDKKQTICFCIEANYMSVRIPSSRYRRSMDFFWFKMDVGSVCC